MPKVARDIEDSKGEPIIKSIRGIHSTIRKMILLLTISACALFSGCKDVVTIWSAEARSPDGQWLAIARTDQHSGPGNAGLETVLYLKATKGPQSPIEILLFTQDAKSIDLKMNWIDSKHLEVTYKEHPSLDFQAVKCAGIDISVRDLSTETSNASQ